MDTSDDFFLHILYPGTVVKDGGDHVSSEYLLISKCNAQSRMNKLSEPHLF